MKNPLIKEEPISALWISGLVTGLVSAGTIAWIFYLKYKAEREASAYRAEHAADYLKPKPGKKHKSDIHDLGTLTHT